VQRRGLEVMKMKDTWNDTMSSTPFVFCEWYMLQTKRFVLNSLKPGFLILSTKEKHWQQAW